LTVRQVFQSLDTGETRVLDVPAPSPGRGEVLIATRRTVISAGTERMLVDFGRASLLGKARQQPERVREVIDKAATDGLAATISAVRSKLAQPMPLGYSNAGVVLETAPDVTDFAPGDRVVSNGPHAEFVCVPANLCAHIPDGPNEISDEAAAFTVLGAIGLQGLRLAEPTLGERFVVTGLGLIGLLTVQLLHAHGCAALGIDPDPDRAELARRFGAQAAVPGEDEAEKVAERFSRGRGVDGVLLTAATSSNEPVQQAARMCRKRGRIVLVGVTGLELSRQEFFEKELRFHVSCSYGPGRYDPQYEKQGLDYPIGFVRWTQTRNFEAILDLLAAGHLDTGPLVSTRAHIDDATDAYGEQHLLGTVLNYPERLQTETSAARVVDYHDPARATSPPGAPVIGLIGAGTFAMQTLIPAFADTGAPLHTVVTRGGSSAALAADRFGFDRASTDPEDVLADNSIDAVVVATHHDTHADLAARSLDAGKHVYVEKPLAITYEGLDKLKRAYEDATAPPQPRILMTGFNRRFAPHIARIQSYIPSSRDPLAIIITVNAGHPPTDHWLTNPSVGGGRIIGEASHFIDLIRYLAASPIANVFSIALNPSNDDSTTITVTFEDESAGTVHYLAKGHPRFSKERLDLFTTGRALTLHNFRRLTVHGLRSPRMPRLPAQDKGHPHAVRAFVNAIRFGYPSPVPASESFDSSAAAISANPPLASPF
jgi:predicted dehydrogenase